MKSFMSKSCNCGIYNETYITVTCFAHVRNLYAYATMNRVKAFSPYSAKKTLLQQFLNVLAKPKGDINKPKINDF